MYRYGPFPLINQHRLKCRAPREPQELGRKQHSTEESSAVIEGKIKVLYLETGPRFCL